MKTIKIFLKSSGELAKLDKDFPLYQGSYNSVSVQTYVPISILAKTLKTEYIDGLGHTHMEPGSFSAIKMGGIYQRRDGVITKTGSYYSRYLKKVSVDGVEYALYERKLPKEMVFLHGELKLVVNVINLLNCNDYTIVDGEVVVEINESEVLDILTSQVCTLDVLQSSRLDKEEDMVPNDKDEIFGEINLLQEDIVDLYKKIETNRINIDTKAKDFTIDKEYLKFDVNRELTLSDRHRRYIYDDISEAMEISRNWAIRDAKEYTDAEITGAKSYTDEKTKEISIFSGTTQIPLKAVEYSIGNYGGGYISFDTTKDTLKIRFLTVTRGSRTFDTISLIEESYMDDFVEGISRELDAIHSKIDQISSPDLFKIVTALPTVGEENRFYFILSDDPETKNMYDEYIWVDNAWELVGTQKLDEVNLENYYNKQQVDTKLETKATQQDIESAIQSAIFDSWQGEV